MNAARARLIKAPPGRVNNNDMVTLESTFRIPDGVVFQELDGEAVILSLDSGQYYGLDAVGTRLWTLLGEHGALAPAYQALLEEYDVAEETLRADVLRLVNELIAAQLLQPGLE